MSRGTFCRVPTIILEDKNLSPSDKLVYAVIYSFKSDQICWASNEYLSNKVCVSLASIKRSLDNLEKFGFIKRSTTQVGAIKSREIILNKNSEVQSEPTEVQSEPTEVQSEPTEVQSEPRTRFNLSPSEVQSEPSIYNIINNTIIDNQLSLFPSPESANENKNIILDDYAPTPCIIDEDKNLSKFVKLNKFQKEKLMEVYKKAFKSDYLRVMRDAIIALDEWFSENPTRYKKAKNHLTFLTRNGLKYRREDEASRILLENRKIMQEKMESKYDNK